MPPSHPDAALLIEEVQGEYERRYGSRDDAPVDDAEFTAPLGAFFVGYLRDAAGTPVPVVTGAWRAKPEVLGEPALEGIVEGRPSDLAPPNPAEIKRMYVRPMVQRRGLARLMLAHVEADLAAAGHDLVVLSTGTAQPEAMALYASSGYVLTPGWGFYRDYPDSRHYAKAL